MAKINMIVDASEASDAIRAACALCDSLPWPARENFRSELDALSDADNVVEELPPESRGPISITLIASAALLDLMRKYEGAAKGAGE